MRLFTALAMLGSISCLVGCGASTSSYVKSDDTTLGRVVLYRNGVAYFERTAEVKDDTLKLAVPADKVNDFLKSLTVTDAATGKPAPVAYPTNVPTDGTGLIDMKIRLTDANGPHKLRLSYVTEAPAWKPSYRIVVGDAGKVELQGWAIVDNTSGEDWNQVKLGVGSSSALSFRFDLRSIRSVHRETLQADGLFAVAPPTGSSTYGGPGNKKRALADFSDDALAALDAPTTTAMTGVPMTPGSAPAQQPAPRSPVTANRKRAADIGPRAESSGGGGAAFGAGAYPMPSPPPAPPMEQQREAQKVAQLANQLRSNANQVTIEGFAAAGDADKKSASLERANKLRDQLVRQGIDPSRVVAIGRAEVTQPKGGVRIVEEPQEERKPEPAKDGNGVAAAEPLQTDPIGTSHFESTTTMNVPKASSAMVSILSTKTEGGVVYLYDPESTRGNASYAFKSVRLINPTDSVLESGPVTVFGQGRFIGEGLSEPIPARASAFVPFALDRQIVVERKNAERDEIARVITVQRGVFSTEVKHVRRAQYVVHNRLGERAVVFVRHTLPQGHSFEKAPETRERMGAAHLFRVELEPSSSKEVVIESSSPVLKSLDLRTPTSFETVKAYLSSSAMGSLKERVGDLAKLQTEIGNLEQRISTTREQMSEYRARMDELHAQLVTLKAVKTAGPLMANLEKKMQETSDRVSKATIELVGLQEKLMVARVRFQDGVAELSLEDKKDEVPSPAKDAKPAPAKTATKS